MVDVLDDRHSPAAEDAETSGNPWSGDRRRPEVETGEPTGRSAPDRFHVRLSVVLAVWLVGGYLFINLAATRILTPDQFVYVAQPAIWLGLGTIAFAGWRRIPDRVGTDSALVVLGVAAAAIQVAMLIAAGLLLGFGNSPYASQLLNVLKNVFYICTMLAGMEMARVYLLQVWSAVIGGWAFVGAVVVFAAAGITITQFARLGAIDTAFETGGGLLLPGVAESTVATLLAAVGGAPAAFAYRATLALFEWTSPILPAIEWPIVALIGTVAPVLALVMIRQVTEDGGDFDEEDRPAPRRAWVVVAVISVGLIWLQAGLFGIQPSVVVGVSMEPTYVEGDMVFVRQVDTDSLTVGDVIRFRSEGTPIVHRIVEATGNGASRVFVTQGDNNAVSPDAPITAAQVEGRVVLRVPKLGLIPLNIQRFLTWLF